MEIKFRTTLDRISQEKLGLNPLRKAEMLDFSLPDFVRQQGIRNEKAHKAMMKTRSRRASMEHVPSVEDNGLVRERAHMEYSIKSVLSNDSSFYPSLATVHKGKTIAINSVDEYLGAVLKENLPGKSKSRKQG